MLRGQLRSIPANGYAAFHPQIRKIVFEFCDKWPTSANTRSYLLTQLQPLASKNPHVEIVVKQRNHKEPIVRGFYGLSLLLYTLYRHSPFHQSTIVIKSFH